MEWGSQMIQITIGDFSLYIFFQNNLHWSEAAPFIFDLIQQALSVTFFSQMFKILKLWIERKYC